MDEKVLNRFWMVHVLGSGFVGDDGRRLAFWQIAVIYAGSPLQAAQIAALNADAKYLFTYGGFPDNFKLEVPVLEDLGGDPRDLSASGFLFFNYDTDEEFAQWQAEMSKPDPKNKDAKRYYSGPRPPQ